MREPMLPALFTPDWTAALPPPPLTALMVYRLALADFTPLPAALAAALTPGEQARAARYHRPADAQRFRVGRGALRHLLGQQLSMHPADVPLGTGPHGKPALPPGTGLHVNVSHAGNWILLALATQPVGIDVEEIVPGFVFREVAAATFSPAEQQLLAAAPDAVAAFLALWTRYEAQAKATGQGLGPGSSSSAAEAAAWAVRSFEPAPGYVAALAHAADWQVQVCFSSLQASSFQ